MEMERLNSISQLKIVSSVLLMKVSTERICMEDKDFIDILEQLDMPDAENSLHQSSLRAQLLREHRLHEQTLKESSGFFFFYR